MGAAAERRLPGPISSTTTSQRATSVLEALLGYSSSDVRMVGPEAS
jgi:hypothetical protein